MNTTVKKGAGVFKRGIHPHDFKELTAECPVEILDTPAAVVVSLVQHIGAPNSPAVAAREKVEAGAVLGSCDAFVSAPVHSPISGIAAAPMPVTLANGRHVPSITVKADGDQLSGQELWDDIYGGQWPLDIAEINAFDPKAILTAVKDAGMVGMGGAGFPTHVKLTPNPEKPVDTLLVNASECEPYLTADYRLMLEAPVPVISGALIAARASGAANVVISIEDNKPLAIGAMRKAAAGTNVEINVTHTKYPMGGEKQLIVAALGREVPTGGLPLDCGVVVINTATAAAIARAVVRGKPLTHRIVTVSGRGVRRPCNILAPVGVSHGALIEHAGGLTEKAVRVIAGGPMMGFAMPDTDAPITKGTSGITVLVADDVAAAKESPCVKCGRCVDVCPLGLVPTKIALAARNQDWDLAKRYYITACMECGCCSYGCPASIPLVQIIRAGKAAMPRD